MNVVTQTDDDAIVSWMHAQMTGGLGLEHTIFEIKEGVDIATQRVNSAIVRLMESDTVRERIRASGSPRKIYYLSVLQKRAQELWG